MLTFSSRYRRFADVAQSAERVLGKDEVTGSSPVISSHGNASPASDCGVIYYFFNLDEIHINLASEDAKTKTTHALGVTLAHEMLHQLRANYAAAYDELSGVVLNALRKNGMDIKKRVAETINNHYVQQKAAGNTGCGQKPGPRIR